MAKVVIFDLGGVYFTDGREIASKKIAKKFNLNPKLVADVMAVSSDFGKQYRRGDITYEEFWEAVKKILYIDAPAEELNRIWYESYEPVAEVVVIAKKLKKKGTKLFYLSDNAKDRVDYLQEKYNFLQEFDKGIFSHEAHVTKRDGPRIFRLALDETREDAENIVFVDDRREHVETAKSLGMQAIQFKNPKQLEADLKKLGVKF